MQAAHNVAFGNAAVLTTLAVLLLQLAGAVPSHTILVPSLKPAGTLNGALRQLSGQQRTGGKAFNQLYLETAHHGHLHLDTQPDTVADVQIGAEVQIQYSSVQGRKLVADRIVMRRQSRGLLQARATAPKGNITMIIFIMDLSLCGSAKPAASAQDIMGFLTKSQPQNLATMYDTCSMGAVQLDTGRTTIINVPFPCNGSLPDGTNFSTNTCDNNNVVHWQTYAAAYAVQLGISLNRYQHRVLVLPKQFHAIMSNCYFDALSSQGRWAFDNDPALGNSWGYGMVWMCGDCWNWAPTYWHEIGHNFGAKHARNEYGPRQDQLGNTSDFVSAMGSWGTDEARCHNAAQLWSMGWAVPAVQLDLTSVDVGRPAQLISIPVQQRGPTGVQVSISSTLSFVLSYRAMLPPYDRPFLHMNMASGVAIHRAPSNVKYTDTALVGLLASAGDGWVEPQSLLSVTLVSVGGSAATVALRRLRAT